MTFVKNLYNHMHSLSVQCFKHHWISEFTLGTRAKDLSVHTWVIIIEMWVKAFVTFFPASYHFEGTWLTLIHALNAYWCGRLFFWLLSFISNLRFTSEDIFKAFVASKPARMIISGITLALAVDFYFIIIILNTIITRFISTIISRFLNAFSSTATGAAQITSVEFSSVIVPTETRIVSICSTVVSVLVY